MKTKAARKENTKTTPHQNLWVSGKGSFQISLLILSEFKEINEFQFPMKSSENLRFSGKTEVR